MRFLLLASLCLCACPAWAAQWRPYTALRDGSVRLSDLWSDLEPGQDQIIGPAPSPGDRVLVPAAQLIAIARQYGVDWSGQGGEQTILETPGTPLPAEALLPALRAALIAHGAPQSLDIALVGYTPPMVMPGDDPLPVIGSLNYDPAAGNFAALITLAGGKGATISLRVTGNVAELANLPVLNRLLAPRQPITAADIKQITLRLPHGDAGIARSADQLIGKALRHVIPPGTPLPLTELTAPQAVAANALVEMDLSSGGLSLQGRGIAEQAGAVGDHIRVRNPASLAVMMGEITGPNQVRIDPASQPIAGTQNQEFAAR